MRKFSHPLKSLKIVVLCLLTAASAAAQENRNGRPVVIDLKQQVEKINDEAPLPLSREQKLDYGDRLRSGPRAFAAIALGDIGVLDIGADSEKVILRPEGVGLERGRLLIALSRAFRGVFRISCPIVSLALRGTLVEILVLHDGTTRIWVYEGEVMIEELDMRVREGTQILIRPDGRALPPSPISLWEPTILLQDPETEGPPDPPLLERLDLRVFGKE